MCQTLRFYDEKRTGENISNMLRVFIAAVLCATALIGNVISSALAGPYPNGPITLVNPYAAGGPADVLARTIIDPLKDMLGQPIVLLNKPGGATAIAAAYVAAAPPDGQTLLLAGASSHMRRNNHKHCRRWAESSSRPARLRRASRLFQELRLKPSETATRPNRNRRLRLATRAGRRGHERVFEGSEWRRTKSSRA